MNTGAGTTGSIRALMLVDQLPDDEYARAVEQLGTHLSNDRPLIITTRPKNGRSKKPGAPRVYPRAFVKDCSQLPWLLS